MKIIIQEDEFNDWINDPVTQFFRKYLIDSMNEESEMLKETILNGDVIPVEDQYRISIMNEFFSRVIEIDHEEIMSFYHQ